MGIAHNPGLAFYNSLAEQPGDSTVDRESIHTVRGGKPSVAQTLHALPTHASDICL